MVMLGIPSNPDNSDVTGAIRRGQFLNSGERARIVTLCVGLLSLTQRSQLYSLENTSRGSSGSIVSDYGLDDRANEVRSPTGAEDFSSSPCVQTGSGAHPASYPIGTGVLFPGVKRGRGVTLTTHPHLVPRLRMSRSYIFSPPMCLHGV
jgi:hypothetical protein